MKIQGLFVAVGALEHQRNARFLALGVVLWYNTFTHTYTTKDTP